MPRFGFRRVLIFTGGMLCIPLIPMLGTPVGWALLPFLAGTLALLWFFIERNYRDGTLHENLRIWPDLITVDRHEPRRPDRHWQANPYWVATQIYPDGRVENYLTLKGNGREIELGAFLSPDERLDLRRDIDTALRDIRSVTAP